MKNIQKQNTYYLDSINKRYIYNNNIINIL